MDMKELEGMIDWCARNLQGYYGRFQVTFEAMCKEDKESFLAEVNAHSVTSVSDFIMFMEA